MSARDVGAEVWFPKYYNVPEVLDEPMKTLLTLLKSDPDKVDSLSIEQVVTLSGNGKLTDNSECSRELREYLQIARSEVLSKYLAHCLLKSFDKSGFVLQDVINELGRRLDYTVENGLYQGRSTAIGFDGLWTDATGHTILVEVKTTDAYRINLDTIAGYREELISAARIGKESSVLLVVGRQDTGDLEAQVRGSKHAWTTRIISADALEKLVSLKENAETESVSKIHELLVPFEYTKLDRIIEIAFTVAEDTSNAFQEDQPIESLTAVDKGEEGQKQHRTPQDVISATRANIVVALSTNYAPMVKKSRALYWNTDKSVRAVVTVSKQYGDSGGYWYAYHESWDKFLAEAVQGFYVLGCIGRNEAYAVPFQWIHSKLEQLNATERESNKHWHILLDSADNARLVLRLNNGQSELLDQFSLSINPVPLADSNGHTI